MKKFLLVSVLGIFALLTIKAIKKPTDITVGTVVIPQMYSPTQIPPQVVTYDVDTVEQVTDGTRYKVINNRSILVYQNNIPNLYYVVDLEAVESYSPIQHITWPSEYVKIAFNGGL